MLASPYVRKVARELGVDLQGAQGSGPGGRVLPADSRRSRTSHGGIALRAEPAAAPARAALAQPEVRPLSPMRKTIARRLTESKQTVPHFYLTIDVDAAGLVKLREQINAELAAAGASATGGRRAAQPAKVSLNDLLIKACAVALVHVPECNASFSPEAILVHKRVDISVAVAIPDGLVTPVLRNADQKSVVAIAREVRELAARARASKLKPEEMTGRDLLDLQPRDVRHRRVLGRHQPARGRHPRRGPGPRRAGRRATARWSPGKRLAMTLSCDHRVVDGAVGAAFLAELRRLLEHPLRVLTG